MIVGYFGKPRHGKTTFLANYVRLNNRHRKINKVLHFQLFHVYDYIYSTDYIRDTIQIPVYDIGLFKPPENSLFLIHEAGVYFNNRNHARTPAHCLNFFALHGHLGCDIVYDSQSANVDLQLRNKSEYVYFVRKLSHWSYATRIRYEFDVDNETHDIVEGYTKPGLLGKLLDFFFGKFKILYRPFCYDYFDSWTDNTKWLRKDDSIYEEYPDSGDRMSLIRKLLFGVKTIALLVLWVLAMVYGWKWVF